MRIEPDFHVTYCSNIHPGETWQDVSEALAVCLPRIRAELGLHGPLGVGLATVRGCRGNPRPAGRPRTFQGFSRPALVLRLHHQRLPVRRVSRHARKRARLRSGLARSRAPRLHQPAGTVAGGAAVRASGDRRQRQHRPGRIQAGRQRGHDVSAIATAILQHAAHLVRLREETGIVVTLGLEPEPACFLETIADVVTFFEDAPVRPARGGGGLHAIRRAILRGRRSPAYRYLLRCLPHGGGVRRAGGRHSNA